MTKVLRWDGQQYVDYDLPSGSTIRSAAANLKKRDLIYPAENGIIVYDRFFGLYLSRL